MHHHMHVKALFIDLVSTIATYFLHFKAMIFLIQFPDLVDKQPNILN